MPTYYVTRYYRGSASYRVVAKSEEDAIEEAAYVNDEETVEDFYDRLSLDYTDSDVYKVEED